MRNPHLYEARPKAARYSIIVLWTFLLSLLFLLPRLATATGCGGDPNCLAELTQAGWSIEYDYGGTLANSPMYPDGVELAGGLLGIIQTVPNVTVAAGTDYRLAGTYDVTGASGNFNIRVDLPDGTTETIYSNLNVDLFANGTFSLPVTAVSAGTGDLVVHIWKDSGLTLNVTDVFLEDLSNPPANPPSASLVVDNVTGLTVTLNGSASTGDGLSYAWDFGDGASDTGSIVTHTYAKSGIYAPTLVVTNSAGEQDTIFLALGMGMPVSNPECDMKYLPKAGWSVEFPYGGVMGDSSVLPDGISLTGGLLGVHQTHTDVNTYEGKQYVVRGRYDVSGAAGNFNIRVEFPNNGASETIYSNLDTDNFHNGVFTIPITATTYPLNTSMTVHVWKDAGVDLEISQVHITHVGCAPPVPSCRATNGGCSGSCTGSACTLEYMPKRIRNHLLW
ncbi:MAG: PKD domain-containing protein [Candidatus Promineifilaceae bacterium]